MPALTGPIFDITLGATNVDPIFKVVEMVHCTLTVVDVILGSGSAIRNVVI